MQFWDDFISWLRTLFGSHPLPDEPVGFTPEPVTRKVALILFDPPVPTQGKQPLSQVLGWNHTTGLVNGFISDLQSSSHGFLNYQIVETIESPAFPVKADGFVYDVDDYLRFWQTGSGFHQPDQVDYHRILADFKLVEKVNTGLIDEVWLMAMPYAGFYESIMAGPGAFFCNAPPLTGVNANRRFIIMGFNYQRGVGEMLESFGHRAEIDHAAIPSAALRVTANLWERFTRYDQTSPGWPNAALCTFAPNSTRDYDGAAPRLFCAAAGIGNYFPT